MTLQAFIPSKGMFLSISLLFLLGVTSVSVAQQSVAIGSSIADQDAVLFLKGNGNQGLIIPIVNTSNINTTSFGKEAMVVFNTADKKLYYHTGSGWVEAGASGGGADADPVIGNEITLVNVARGGLEITGAGTAASPFSVGIIQGTVDGQILKWDNTAKKWVLGTDNAGGAPTVDNVTIENVGGLRVKDAGISTAKIAADAVTRDHINVNVAGTGLVQAANGSLGVDVGTTANKIVQLDATGKLPAVDGSQLTNLAGGGDITGVAAGTGLTGGGATGAVTLTVDAGTTANKIVQLDATGKLPAVDGSQLTNLPAGGDITGVTAGTGLTGGGATGAVTLTVDAGTTANKIVQLDATGKLPAVDGSQLTNLPVGGDITGVTAGTGLTGGGATGAVTLTVDVGTTANKIVQLDASGRLPAVNGSLLTSLPDASATNEVQNLSLSGTGSATMGESFPLAISLGGAGVTIREGTNVQIDQAANVLTINSTSPTSGTVTNVSGTAPISVTTPTTTPVISIAQANTTTNGYLSSTDWNTFNNKLSVVATSANITDGAITGADLAPTISISTTGNLATTGTGSLTVAGPTTLTTLGGSGPQMVVVDNAGLLSKQPLPTAGTLQSAYDGGQTVTGTNTISLAIANGFLTSGTYGSGTIPTTGAGARMMYYPRKAAFRVGRTFNDTGTESQNWDDANIGDDSFAAGQNTVAIGIRSFAVGKRSRAVGSASVAMGDGTTANEFCSVAMGFGATAEGHASIAGGRYTTASSMGGVAFGFFNLSGGNPTSWVATDPLFELGNGTDFGARSNAFTVLKNGRTSVNGAAPVVTLEINGTDAVKLPAGTTAQRPGTPVAGYFRYNSTTQLPEIYNGGWQSLSVGSGSVLINNTGTRNLFAGDLVATAGTDNASFGYHAGSNNTGSFNVYVGTQAGENKTTGGLNTLVGWNAGRVASANANTMIGAQAGEVTTGGTNTFIGEKAGQANLGGTSNVFVGNSAGNTNTSGTNNTIIGYNADVGASGLINATAIGNGATVSTSNSLVLGNNANVGIGTSSPTVPFHLTPSSTSYAARIEQVGTGHGLLAYVNTTSATQTVFSASGNTTGFMVLGNGRTGIGRSPAANDLEVEGSASKTTATAWLANSDRRIKTDIQDIDNSLDLIKKLRPVRFKYTEEWKTRHPSIKDQYYYNFIAQEYQQVFPESVQGSGEFLANDSENILQIDTYNAQITTIKAVQELITKIEQLETENKKLKSENGTLEAKVSSIENQQESLLKDVEELKRILGAQAAATKK